jgi:hypothetical protein
MAKANFELTSCKQGLHHLYSLMDHARRKVVPKEFGGELEEKGQVIEDACRLNHFDLAKAEIAAVAEFLENCDEPITDRRQAQRELHKLISKSRTEDYS